MIYTILFEYEESAQVMTTLHFNNIVSAPALHDHLWFLDGTRGSALLSNPMGTAKLSVSLKDSPEQVQTYEIAGTWDTRGSRVRWVRCCALWMKGASRIVQAATTWRAYAWPLRLWKVPIRAKA